MNWVKHLNSSIQSVRNYFRLFTGVEASHLLLIKFSIPVHINLLRLLRVEGVVELLSLIKFLLVYSL